MGPLSTTVWSGTWKEESNRNVKAFVSHKIAKLINNPFFSSVENPEIVIHDNTNKFEVDEFLEDFWPDLLSLGANAIREYSIAFCTDPICSIALTNARLGEDLYQQRKLNTERYPQIQTMVNH